MFGKYFLGGALAIALIAGAVSYSFYKQNSKLKEEVTLQAVQIENHTDTIDTFKESFKEIQASIIDMNNKTTSINKVASDTKERLDGTLRTHDIDELTRRKAGLVTRIVNREVRKVSKILQELTNPSYVVTNILNIEVKEI